MRRRVTLDATPPWKTREKWRTGAPRICKTNAQRPVEVKGKDGMVTVGVYDYVLRLYSHTGLTPVSVVQEIDGESHVVYEPQEWDRITECGLCRWLEYVNDHHMVCARISVAKARTNFKTITRQSRILRAVPLNLYEQERRHP